MVIYLDLIIISNFIINFLFLYFIEKSFGDNIKLLRIILASLVGGLSVLLYFVDYVFVVIFKIVGGIIIVMIGISPITKSKQIIKISLFYTLNFAFVGLLQSFKINTWYLLILSIIAILGLFIFENSKKYLIFIKSCKYNIIADFNGELIKIEGFLDTGNECFFNDVPVIFINNKYKPAELTYADVALVSTVSGNKYECYYKPNGFWIEINKRKIRKEVYIVFSDIEKECLINPYIII